MNLNTPITQLKGIGEKSAALFKKLNILSIGDLLMHFPREYEIFEEPVNISQLKIGNIQTVRGAIASIKGPIKAGRFTIINVVLKEGLNTLELTFFNQPYIKNILKSGGFYLFRGKVIQKGTRLLMTSPRIYKPDEYKELLAAPVAKYPLSAGLSSKAIGKAVNEALKIAEFDEDIFPQNILDKYNLIHHDKAIRMIHQPANMDDVTLSRNRLVFEEFFCFIMLLRRNKEISLSLSNSFPMIETAETKRFVEALPFKLTSGQKKTWKQILDDLTGPSCMNRLIQGDVGSGKTIVAILSLLLAVTNGYQGALMAPTEVLAMQHMETVKEYISKYKLPFKPVLLVGSLKTKEKRECYEAISSGEANLIIGTHALIQEKVVYKNLGLVVTDEQHRFGVRQRESLAQKSSQPHILVMSATPIPRTLAIILYGDLSLSAIHELPADRLPIKNCVVGIDFRDKAYRFIEAQVNMGHQAYVICSQVEAGENEDLENVVDYTDKLKDAIPNINIEYLHGKMSASQKADIMERFSRREIDVLVSTTVIEVGINVPNATVMMVENSERFGLAQLHQLRGRVGRGQAQSYCIFITSSNEEHTMERLNILNTSNDGFHIASEDLRLRGPGELFGIRQSGEFAFEIGDIYADSSILEKAGECIDELTKNDPKLRAPENERIKDFVQKYMDKSEFLQSI